MATARDGGDAGQDVGVRVVASRRGRSAATSYPPLPSSGKYGSPIPGAPGLPGPPSSAAAIPGDKPTSTVVAASSVRDRDMTAPREEVGPDRTRGTLAPAHLSGHGTVPFRNVRACRHTRQSSVRSALGALAATLGPPLPPTRQGLLMAEDSERRRDLLMRIEARRAGVQAFLRENRPASGGGPTSRSCSRRCPPRSPPGRRWAVRRSRSRSRTGWASPPTPSSGGCCACSPWSCRSPRRCWRTSRSPRTATRG